MNNNIFDLINNIHLDLARLNKSIAQVKIWMWKFAVQLSYLLERYEQCSIAHFIHNGIIYPL